MSDTDTQAAAAPSSKVADVVAIATTVVQLVHQDLEGLAAQDLDLGLAVGKPPRDPGQAH